MKHQTHVHAKSIAWSDFVQELELFWNAFLKDWDALAEGRISTLYFESDGGT